MFARYFFVCDNVIKDIHTNTLSFINIRNGFVVESFPINVSNFFVVAGFNIKADICGVNDKFNSQLKIISPQNKIVLDLKQSLLLIRQPENSSVAVDLIFKIDNLLCRDNGIYRVQILEYEKELIMSEMELEIGFPKKTDIPYKAKSEIDNILLKKDLIRKVESSVCCPNCGYEKKFSLGVQSGFQGNVELENSFPDTLIYVCDNCGKWKMHLGRMAVFMYNKLGQPSSGNINNFNV